MIDTEKLLIRLHEQGLGYGMGPAILCQEAAAWITAAVAREAKLQALVDAADAPEEVAPVCSAPTFAQFDAAVRTIRENLTASFRANNPDKGPKP